MTAKKLSIDRRGMTGDQERAVAALSRFFEGDPVRLFLLGGFAGTGKTFLLQRLAEALVAAKRPFCFLAPTGRAARILGERTGLPAQTIHSLIYQIDRVREYEQDAARFQLRFESVDPAGVNGQMVYLVDESSLIGDREGEQEFLKFGSGRLLKDLLEFTRVGVPGLDTRIVMAGDPAQLAPVSESFSPALSVAYLAEEHRLPARVANLNEVVRQKSESPILRSATEIREALMVKRFNRLAIPETPPAIRSLTGEAAAKLLAESALARAAQGAGGRDADGVLVSHSNEKTLKYNRAVRARLWGDDQAPLRAGDRLLVQCNNPHWGLMNGDFAQALTVGERPEIRLVPVRNMGEQSLTFRAVTLGWINGQGEPVQSEGLILENLLESRERELTRGELMALYVDFKDRNPDLNPRTSAFEKALRADLYFNALRVKYGYAVTCHKAQGGEWDRVIVDFQTGGGWANPAYFRWCYTAITRARTELWMIDPPAYNHAWTEIRRVKGPATGGAESDAGNGRKSNSGLALLVSDWTAEEWPGAQWAEGHAPLREKAGLFAAALRANGFEPVGLEHGRYFERYRVRAGARVVTLQAYYDGRMRFRAPQAPGLAEEPEVQRIAALFQAAIPADGGAPTEGTKPQAAELRAKLEELRTSQGVEVVRLDSGDYVDRATLRRKEQVAEIDFHHDAKGRYTSWQMIRAGDPVFSAWLADQVENLLMTPENSVVAGMDLLE